MSRSLAVPSGRPVRVLMATHNYPRWPGDPAGAFVALLARALASAGTHVCVLAPHAVGLAVDVVEDGVRVRRFRYAPERWELAAYGATGQRVGVRRLGALASVPAFLAAYRRAVRSETRGWQPDVVHAHWWMPGAVVAAGGRVPLVVTSHGTDVRLLANPGLSRHVARRLAPVVARWTAVSQFLADELLAGVGADRLPCVTVTPMPVDVPAAVPTEASDEDVVMPNARRDAGADAGIVTSVPRLLYAGNLLMSKGIDVLIEAVALLRDRGLPVTLRIVGQGPAREPLRHLARQRGVVDCVDWAGPQPHSAMPAEFSAAAMTILPSRAGAEGLGLVLVEALLHGCPVVGTNAGGIPETVIPGVTGLLARPGDAEDLARQIARLLRDPALSRRLAAAGRARAYERHAPSRCAARFLELYADVIPPTRSHGDAPALARWDATRGATTPSSEVASTAATSTARVPATAGWRGA